MAAVTQPLSSAPPPPTEAEGAATALIQAMANLELISRQVQATQSLLQQCLKQHPGLSVATTDPVPSSRVSPSQNDNIIVQDQESPEVAPTRDHDGIKIAPVATHSKDNINNNSGPLISEPDTADWNAKDINNGGDDEAKNNINVGQLKNGDDDDTISKKETEPIAGEISNAKDIISGNLDQLNGDDDDNISKKETDPIARKDIFGNEIDASERSCGSALLEGKGSTKESISAGEDSMTSFGLQGSISNNASISNVSVESREQQRQQYASNPILTFDDDGSDEEESEKLVSSSHNKHRESLHSSFSVLPTNSLEFGAPETRRGNLKKSHSGTLHAMAAAAKKRSKPRGFGRFFGKDDDSEKSHNSNKSTSYRRRDFTPPRRNFNWSSDDTHKMKPKRPAAPKRTLSQGRGLTRTLSQGKGLTRTLSQKGQGLMRWPSSHSLRQNSRQPSKRNIHTQPKNSLNIFCSDMVSEEFILQKLEELANDTDIVQLELEDCLVTPSTSRTQIPLRLREIVDLKDRDWKGIRMVDELLDGWVYSTFQESKRQLLQTLGLDENSDSNKHSEDNTHLLEALGLDDNSDENTATKIPISFQTRIRLSDTNLNEDENANDEETPLTLLQLLQAFQKDSGIIKLDLTINEQRPSLELVQAIQELLHCDDRKWEDMKLQFQFATTEEGEEGEELPLKEALESLQAVAKARGIRGSAGWLKEH